jgi:ABC-type phosphate/phosphonate transport system ATPase subunit
VRLLTTIHEQDGIPVLISLHQLEAVGYADQVVGLRAGEIVFTGAPAALTESMIQRIYYADDEPSAPRPRRTRITPAGRTRWPAGRSESRDPGDVLEDRR